VDFDRTAVCLVMSETARLSRRCLLARLTALPAIFGFAAVADPGSSRAKNGHGKGKHHHRKKHGSKKKGNGGGRGYAPDGEELAFLALINDYRGQHGVGALTLQNHLGAAADHHARDMAQRNYYEHSALGSLKTFGYTNWRYFGEIICAGYASASSAMDAWKSSADHNKMMLDANYTEIGIGRAYNQNSDYDWYWTTSFGSR
jgi:uncharacterized protein YkwD